MENTEQKDTNKPDIEFNSKETSKPHKDDRKVAETKKKGRIIIRNLVWDIKEKHLRQLLGKYGEIQEINIPINPATNRGKGFAFVQFSNRNMAAKAIKVQNTQRELNETTYKGRTILLDFSVAKEKYEQAKKQKEQSSRKEDNGEMKDESEEQNEEDNDNEMDEENEEDNEDEEEEGDEDEDEGIEEEDLDQEDDEDLENGEEDEEGAEGEVDEEEEEEEEKDNQDEDLGSTIYVRNVSFDTTEKEFRKFFQGFGPIFYAKLVKRDEETHNGSGFVKFKSKEIAEKLIKESQRLEQIDPLSKSVGLSEINLELAGRRLKILPALHKKEVAEIQKNRKEKFEAGAPKNKNSIEYWMYVDKHNKRNLALLKYGLNEPEEHFSEFDKAKFEANKQEKIMKLQNPNYHLSKTKVIFKNLPKKDFDEDDLRDVVKKVLAQKYNEKVLKKKKLINKVKIERETERTDADGNYRSRVYMGYGFVDFVEHEDALFFLEKIKDQYKMISEQKVPIIEFAFEDIKVVKKKEKILEKIKKNREAHTTKLDDKDEEKERKKKELKNAQNLAKLQLEQLLAEGKKEDFNKVKELLSKIKSRGLKQRLKKRIKQVYGLPQETSQKSKPKEDKQSKIEKKIKAKEQAQQKQQEIKQRKERSRQRLAEENEILTKIKKSIKNKKKEKRRAEDHDEFDEMAQAYLKKVQKI